MRRFTTVLVLFTGVILCTSFTGITKNDVDIALNRNKLKHPYLYFSNEEKPAILERIKNNPESRDIMNRLLAEVNVLMSMPVDRNIPIQGKNTRAGWTEYDKDGKYDKVMYTNRENAFRLAFVYQMTGERNLLLL